jgi:hypothetical protein
MLCGIGKRDETFEKLHKTRLLVIHAKAGIKYLFMVPRFHGDDAWIPAGACPRMYLSGAGMTGVAVFQRSHRDFVI